METESSFYAKVMADQNLEYLGHLEELGICQKLGRAIVFTKMVPSFFGGLKSSMNPFTHAEQKTYWVW